MQSTQAHYLNHQTTPNPTSGVVKIALVSLFALLWAIWIQPHTIALRQIVLTLGSLLGLYVMIRNLHLFKTRHAIPIYLIGLLFVWITFHLFFLSHQYELQLAEYLTIWKRIAWSVPFAIGLGIALSQSTSRKATGQNGYTAKYEWVWWIFYAGVVAPTVIYLTRTTLMVLAGKFGWQLPVFLMHSPIVSTWHITKMSLEFFCLPALAMACCQCIYVANPDRRVEPPLPLFFSLFITTISAVLAVFYFENAKNGFAYSATLILVMLFKISIIRWSRWSWRETIVMTIALMTIVLLVSSHVEKNNSWKTLLADIKVAQHIETIDAWKDYGARGYPVNELGNRVSLTNYERAAWAKVATILIGELPLGYGLVDGSFGHIAKEKWPESTLFQAHSAWLDLILGIGIPGVFLLILAGYLALKNADYSSSCYWATTISWVILSFALLMLTTEFSHKLYIEPLLFLVLVSAGMGLWSDKNLPKSIS